ncbi:glycosyltransferase [Methylosinus sp. H3A]|uniref:glycosyltransferase family 4 protein n=1 Tax=Methylosinus sp. H3A TaxID=2785786 RepID=UPI0018C1F074|nr:glycosyltransferase [Methylosinus sp. H3A]MBG0808336.1 glycosyltransferase [Methylosinus sp. H3A]
MSRVVQYHPSVISADAIGASISSLHQALRELGVASYVACSDSNIVNSDYATLSTSMLKRMAWRDTDLLLLHYSFFNDELESLIDLPVRKILIYHNVTPGHFFRSHRSMSFLGDLCDHARGQMRRFASAFESAVGDSDYNSAELREFGFRNPETIPVFFNDAFFTSRELDNELYFDIKASSEVNIVFVGRFVPNKRHDLLIDILAAYKRLFGRSASLHLAGKIWDNEYFHALLGRAVQGGVLSNVKIYQNASGLAVKTLFAASDAFISMSEHEGFMVPVLEAFSVGCPVLAYSSTAVGETMGTAGIKFDTLDPAIPAGYLELLRRDKTLRNEIVREQADRVTDFYSEATARKWLSFLGGFVDISAGLNS